MYTKKSLQFDNQSDDFNFCSNAVTGTNKKKFFFFNKVCTRGKVYNLIIKVKILISVTIQLQAS